LAEVEAAEFLLLVANAADPELDDKMRAVRGVLNDELNVAETPQIVVLNQSDRLSHEDRAALLLEHRDAVFTSALTGEGWTNCARAFFRSSKLATAKSHSRWMRVMSAPESCWLTSHATVEYSKKAGAPTTVRSRRFTCAPNWPRRWCEK
jgi:50S ribosomal subunit-associated GTPase HflX